MTAIPTTKTATIARAITYCRVSTEDQAEHGTSLESQRAACLAKAESIGARLVAQFEDAGVSGARYLTRTGLQSALECIERGEADTLIIANLSRYSRDKEHQATIKKRVDRAGARLVFCDMDFADTPEGDLAFGMFGAFAEYERQVIRDRTVKGRRRRAMEGQQVARSLSPYGYVVVTRDMVIRGEYPADQLGRYQIIEEQAKWVRAMYQWYASGVSMRQIGMRLMDHGVPAPSGAVWHPSTFQRLLANPVYKGEPTYGRTKRVTDENRATAGYKTLSYLRPAAEETIIRLSAPPIVSAEEWDFAQSRLDVNRAVLAGRGDRAWLLTGILRCPKCGRTMKAQPRPTKASRGYYACKFHAASLSPTRTVCYSRCHPANVMEDAVLTAVRSIVDAPDSVRAAYEAFLASELDACAPSADSVDATVQTLQKQRTALDERQRATVKAQIAGVQAGIDPSAYAGEFAEIAAERKRLDEAAAKLANAAGARPAETGRRQRSEIEAEINALVSNLSAVVEEIFADPDITTDEKKRLLCRLVRVATPVLGPDGEPAEREDAALRVDFHPLPGLTVPYILLYGS